MSAAKRCGKLSQGGKRWMETHLPFLSHHKPLPRPFAIDLRPLAITIVTR